MVTFGFWKSPDNDSFQGHKSIHQGYYSHMSKAYEHLHETQMRRVINFHGRLITMFEMPHTNLGGLWIEVDEKKGKKGNGT